MSRRNGNRNRWQNPNRPSIRPIIRPPTFIPPHRDIGPFTPLSIPTNTLPVYRSNNHSVGLQTITQGPVQQPLPVLQRRPPSSQQPNQDQQVPQAPEVPHEQQEESLYQIEQQDMELFKPQLEEEWDPNHWSASLSCSVCFEPYTESYVLVCGHTWCSGCLNAMVTLAHKRAPRRPLEAITVTCPTCRRSQPHGQYAKHAPRNRTLESVVDGWLKSEDRRKHLIPKIDKICQTEDQQAGSERAKETRTHQAVQTEEWPPPKVASVSTGQQVSLPAPGSSISTQTAPPAVRDAQIQTSNIKSRSKQTQTMFVRTRTSGVQVGTAWEGAVLTALATKPTLTDLAASQFTAIGHSGQIQIVSENTATPSSSSLASSIQVQTGPAIPSVPIINIPRPPMTDSAAQTQEPPKRLCHRACQTTMTAASPLGRPRDVGPWSPCKSWYNSLEYYLGTDVADVAECLLEGDVWAVLLFVFLLVIDWRHVVAGFVTDVSMSGGSDYTLYTLKALTHTALVALGGSLCFALAMFYLIREASDYLNHSLHHKHPAIRNEKEENGPIFQ